MIRLRAFLISAILVLATVACHREAPSAEPVAAKQAAPVLGFVTVDGQRFVDPQGRQLLLHGIAVIEKSRSQGYLPWAGEKEFATLRSWGMNCIRLGIFWDGVEPEPGKYDDSYLAEIDKRIAWAKQNGLYVLLDMHQDLYSPTIEGNGGDGAPVWATLTDGKKHVGGGVIWSDAYLTSPAIQTAFDNLWANKPASDGVGLQDHFAKMWQHVAKRYAAETAVLGYDLFNEPNAGSANLAAMGIMVNKAAEAMAARQGANAIPPGELAKRWLDPGGRAELFGLLGDMTVYTAMVDAGQGIFGEFERTKLMPMYQRIANAIREVDANHILFLETDVMSNLGVRTAITPVTIHDGTRDPQQAYAPHAYDIVTDTSALATPNTERLALIFDRHKEASMRLDMPMLVGEWGAFGGSGSEIVPAARGVVRELERTLASETYWDFGRYISTSSYLESLYRPFPEQVAGLLMNFRYDPETKTLACTWREDPGIKAPTRIYLPERCFPGKDHVTLKPAGDGIDTKPVAGTKNVYLEIPPTGRPDERTLTVK